MIRFTIALCKISNNLMPNSADIFLSLGKKQQRSVHLDLCRNALRIWETYTSQFDEISYIEGVVGTFQVVDKTLPHEAFEAVIRGRNAKNIDWRYAEPINAMHDEDLEFPENIKFAYYAIYNLFNKYIQQQNIDDWLICNQALSAETNPERWQFLLNQSIKNSLA